MKMLMQSMQRKEDTSKNELISHEAMLMQSKQVVTMCNIFNTVDLEAVQARYMDFLCIQ